MNTTNTEIKQIITTAVVLVHQINWNRTAIATIDGIDNERIFVKREKKVKLWRALSY